MVKNNVFNYLPSSYHSFLFPFCLVFMFSSFLTFFKFNFFISLIFSFFFVFIYLLIWIKDIFLEGLVGKHTFFMQDGFKLCFYYFLFSEIMFFFSFFWFLFDTILVPTSELGEFWTPLGLEMVNPFGIPFLNSLILLSSAVTLTWGHFLFLEKKAMNFAFILTILLGLIFLFIQMMEYKQSNFNLSDGVFGSLFYLMTGFHGLHVFLGILFLLMNFKRFKNNLMDNLHHLSLEFSIIYWHFVDVIWLFLYLFLYWWSF